MMKNVVISVELESFFSGGSETYESPSGGPDSIFVN
jgi:hypothetical protein